LQAQGLDIQRQQLAQDAPLRIAQTRQANADAQLKDWQFQRTKEVTGIMTGGGGAEPAPAAPPGTPVSPQQYLQNIGNQQQPSPTAIPPPLQGGVIGGTLKDMLSDEKLNPQDKTQLIASGWQSLLSLAQGDLANVTKPLLDAHNAILTRRGQEEERVKQDTEPQPSDDSPTGFIRRMIRPDNTQVGPGLPVAPPVPKSLQESAAMLGGAELRAKENPNSTGAQAAVDYYKKVHEKMNADIATENAQKARDQALALGKNIEEMSKSGFDPIVKDANGKPVQLTFENAPMAQPIDPTSGQPIPTDFVHLHVIPERFKQLAGSARNLLYLTDQVSQIIDKNPKLTGPISGLTTQAALKMGVSSEDAGKLNAFLNFAKTTATGEESIGRISPLVLENMSDLLKMNAGDPQMKGVLAALKDIATHYSTEDEIPTKYQWLQRQQFEAQGAQPAAGGRIAGPPPGMTHKVPGPDGKLHYTNETGTVDGGLVPAGQ
jgi:hypothetical protein